MSYCRFSEGDVYLFSPEEGRYVCSCCRTWSEHDRTFDSAGEALAHLRVHRELGHVVPDHAFVRLRREMYGQHIFDIPGDP